MEIFKVVLTINSPTEGQFNSLIDEQASNIAEIVYNRMVANLEDYIRDGEKPVAAFLLDDQDRYIVWHNLEDYKGKNPTVFFMGDFHA
jgi:hypothetical protein